MPLHVVYCFDCTVISGLTLPLMRYFIWSGASKPSSQSEVSDMQGERARRRLDQLRICGGTARQQQIEKAGAAAILLLLAARYMQELLLLYGSLALSDQSSTRAHSHNMRFAAAATD